MKHENKNSQASRVQIVSIPGAGFYLVSGNLSSKGFKTVAAARAARTRGTAMSPMRTWPCTAH